MFECICIGFTDLYIYITMNKNKNENSIQLVWYFRKDTLELLLIQNIPTWLEIPSHRIVSKNRAKYLARVQNWEYRRKQRNLREKSM